MKSPEEYFSIKKVNKAMVYEWKENSRVMVLAIFGIMLITLSFVKTVIEGKAPLYFFVIITAVVILVVGFFWVYDRFRLVLDNDGFTMARGITVLWGSNSGTRYEKGDFLKLFSRSPTNYTNDNFDSDTQVIYVQLKNKRTVRLTNALQEEHVNFLKKEIKLYHGFSAKPAPVPWKLGPKVVLAWAGIVFMGVVSPRLAEVGEFSIEDQSNPMRVATGLLGMSFIFWIITFTDQIFKKGELPTGAQVILYIFCFVPTAVILWYLYLT